MDSVRLTIEIPAELATAIAGFLESMKIVAVERNEKETKPSVVDVVCDMEQVPLPESVEEVEDFCRENNLVVNGRRFFNFYKDRNWHDTNGKLISNWKERILLWDDGDRKKNPNKVIRAPRPTGKDDTERLTKMLSVEGN